MKNNKDQLRKEVLSEIPGQIVSYYKKIGRPPNPPRGISRSFEGPRRSPRATMLPGTEKMIPHNAFTPGVNTLAPTPIGYSPPLVNPKLNPGVPELEAIQINYPEPPGTRTQKENAK